GLGDVLFGQGSATGDPVEGACQPLVQSLEHSQTSFGDEPDPHGGTAPGDDHVGRGSSPGSSASFALSLGSRSLAVLSAEGGRPGGGARFTCAGSGGLCAICRHLSNPARLRAQTVSAGQKTPWFYRNWGSFGVRLCV